MKAAWDAVAGADCGGRARHRTRRIGRVYRTMSPARVRTDALRIAA
jgi:hypothetical protein